MSGVHLGSLAHEATCNDRASGGKEHALNNASLNVLMSQKTLNEVTRDDCLSHGAHYSVDDGTCLFND